MNTDAVLSGIVLVLFVILLVVRHLARKAGAVQQEPDVGADIFDCTMVHDCDGCDGCGAPMVIDEDVSRPYMSAQWWMDQPRIELPISAAGVEELEEMWRRS